VKNTQTDDNMRDVIAKIIATRRREKQWTQKELAEKTGLSVNTINRFEKGHRVPDVLQFIQLGALLGLSLDRILNTAIEFVPISSGVLIKDDKSYSGAPELVEQGLGQLVAPGIKAGDVAFRISSMAMAPLVTSGDYAVVKKHDFGVHDMVAFLDQWRNVNIRWLRENDHQKFLVAENPDYPAIPLSGKEEILGQVIAIVRVSQLT
jgi:transcriptional regulator with XRE-family HTH domain